jgi:AcrR family transcriptional regulator
MAKGKESENETKDAGASAPAALGRKRDHSRDGAILDAAIDVLGEVGYTAMTMDMVAVRAKAGKATVYRRWASKEELILDAVARMKGSAVDLQDLPDTGDLREDLIALFRPQSAQEDTRRLNAMAGLASLLSHRAVFAEAAHSALIEPWSEAHRLLMGRAVGRGEIPAAADIETICEVLPTMAAYRTIVQRKPFDRDFLVTTVDVLIMPALRYGSRGSA